MFSWLRHRRTPGTSLGWPWSILWRVSLFQPLIDHKPIDPLELLFPVCSFFLFAIHRSLNSFMLQSANWNMMIYFICERLNYAGVSSLSSSSLRYNYLAPSSISDGNSGLKFQSVTAHLYVLQHLFLQTTLRCIQIVKVTKHREKMTNNLVFTFLRVHSSCKFFVWKMN